MTDRSLADSALDAFYKAPYQIGDVLHERLREYLEFLAVLIEAVPMDAVVAQNDRLEGNRTVVSFSRESRTIDFMQIQAAHHFLGGQAFVYLRLLRLQAATEDRVEFHGSFQVGTADSGWKNSATILQR